MESLPLSVSELLRMRLLALGYKQVVLDHNEVYVEDEERMVRIGFIAQVEAMTDAAIAYEVEAEITSQEENEAAGWA
jgi:hypothetical protein